MLKTDRVLQVLGVPYSALLSIIFGMMILSFPIGAYVFFDTGIGGDITHEYPLAYAVPLFAPVLDRLPFEASLGDGFVVLWSAFAVLFAVGISGPRRDFMRTLASILSSGRDSPHNYTASMLKWFGVFVLASAAIDTVQGAFGVGIEPPEFGNDLVRFFSASLAPFVEEIGFRVVLIGLPLYAVFHRHVRSGRGLAGSLWHPSGGAGTADPRPAFVLIAASGILFGLAHVLFGEPWSGGKFSQAAVGGIILGWVYYRHGLAAAVLLHWATNYFVLSYLFFVAVLNDVAVEEVLSHSLPGTLETILVASGAVSLAFLVANRFCRPAGRGPETGT